MMDKPREWWIMPPSIHSVWEQRVSTKPDTFEIEVHVIEKSYADSLEQKLKVAVDALKFYANGENLNVADHDVVELECEGSRMTDRVIGKTAREALAKIEGGE